MNARSFDRVAWAAIILSLVYTVSAATSWNWFPSPRDWGDIARIPASIQNYIALLLPPSTLLVCLVLRRLRFNKELEGTRDKDTHQMSGKAP
jgi:hypothetical protein